MPVVFQPAEPMAPQIQAGGGAAEIATKDFPSLAQMYESNQRNSLAASTAQAQISASAQAAHAQSFNQATAYAQQNEQAQRQFAASQQPSERDTYLASVQAAAAQQHAQLQSWLSNQELSQAEGMRLQRMQNAVGAIQADPSLDDETKMGLITQLKTGIDPLKQRLENAKAKFEQEQMQKVHQQQAQQEAWKTEGDKFAKANAPDGILYLDDNHNVVTKDFAGHKQALMRNHQGEWKPIDTAKATTGAGGAQEKEYHAARLAAQKRLDGLAQNVEKELIAANKKDSDVSQEDKDRLKTRLDSLRQNELTNLRGDLENAGMGFSWAEHQKRGQPPVQNQAPGATSAVNQPGPNAPQQTAPPPPPKPIDLQKPTDHEKQLLGTFDEQKKRVGDANLPAARKEELQDYIDEKRKLVVKYGTYEAMANNPDDLARYNDLAMRTSTFFRMQQMAKQRESLGLPSQTIK